MFYHDIYIDLDLIVQLAVIFHQTFLVDPLPLDATDAFIAEAMEFRNNYIFYTETLDTVEQVTTNFFYTNCDYFLIIGAGLIIDSFFCFPVYDMIIFATTTHVIPSLALVVIA